MKKIFTLLFLVSLLELNAQTVTFTTTPAAVANTVAGRDAAGQQDDAFHANLDDQCVAAGGSYTPVYGSFTINTTTTNTLSGLFLPNGNAYSGTVAVSARLMDGSAKGTIIAGSPTVTNTGNNNIQSNAPYPTGANGRFSENSSSAANPNGVLFEFSVPITTPFSFWLGDVESRTDGLAGTPGLIKVFDNAGTVLNTTNIPTSSTDQTACNGGGAASFSGCGNNETIFVTVTPTAGVPVTSVLVQVGASDAGVNANAIGIGGPTMGGSCSIILALNEYNFTAIYKNGNTVIHWLAAANEQNINNYSIEKSTNGRDFAKVTTVVPNGNGNYTFNDKTDYGTFYYRLKIQEKTGSYYYSIISKVVANSKNNVSVYPNPATNFITVENTNNNASKTTILVLNTNGAVVSKSITNGNFTKINVSRLPAAVYYVKIISDADVIIQKFIKQ